MIETEDDLRSFFDTDDFAVTAHITDGDEFNLDLAVLVDDDTEDVAPYPETSVTVPDVSFLALDVDLVGVKRRMSVTFSPAAGDPVHARLSGKTFTIERISGADPGTSRVALKE